MSGKNPSPRWEKVSLLPTTDAHYAVRVSPLRKVTDRIIYRAMKTKKMFSISFLRKYESTKVLSYIFVVLSYDTAISISVRRYSKLLHYTYTYYDTVHIFMYVVVRKYLFPEVRVQYTYLSIPQAVFDMWTQNEQQGSRRVVYILTTRNNQ